MFLHHRERFRSVNLPADQQHGVIRLIVIAIKSLQAWHRYILNIGARTDGRFTIVVPQEHGRDDALGHDIDGTVFTNLEFIAHHRHFTRQIARANGRIHHAIRFERQSPIEIFFARGKYFVIVGAISPGGSIPLRTALREFLGDLWVIFAALEQHVLQQMRHARLTIIFMARTNEVGDVDDNRWLRHIGGQ